MLMLCIVLIETNQNLTLIGLSSQKLKDNSCTDNNEFTGQVYNYIIYGKNIDILVSTSTLCMSGRPVHHV